MLSATELLAGFYFIFKQRGKILSFTKGDSGALFATLDGFKQAVLKMADNRPVDDHTSDSADEEHIFGIVVEGNGAVKGSESSVGASVVVLKAGADDTSAAGAAEVGAVAAGGAGAGDGGTSADGSSVGGAAEAVAIAADRGAGDDGSTSADGGSVITDDTSHLEIGQRVASAIYDKQLVSEFLRLEINDMNTALMNLLTLFKDASSDLRTYVTSVTLQPHGHRLSIQVWLPASF